MLVKGKCSLKNMEELPCPHARCRRGNRGLRGTVDRCLKKMSGTTAGM